MHVAGQPRTGSRRPPVPVPAGLSADALAVAHATTRALLTATDAVEVVALLVDAVRDLGGEVVPADLAPSHALPVDLGLGEAPPLLAVAPPVSVAEMDVRLLVPSLVEDARAVVLRLQASVRLSGEASSDPLTGLLTRRALFRRLALLGPGASVCLLDLDHFKRLNDTAGHDAGDAALAAFGALLRSSVREDDAAGRYGGEEFLVAVPVGPDVAAARVAELRERWRRTTPPVTFSAGIAVVTGTGAHAAVTAADRALYRAKAAGRDRTELATAADQPVPDQPAADRSPGRTS